MSCPRWPRPPPNVLAGLRPRSWGPRIGNTWSGRSISTGVSNIAQAPAGAGARIAAAHTSGAPASRNRIQPGQLDGRAPIHDGPHTRLACPRHRFLVDHAELEPHAARADRD